jgi:hypothetical protein
MFIIVLFHLCPHESLKTWNFNTFLQNYLELLVFSSLQLLIHASPSPSPFIVLMPSLAPLWIVIFPPALLWMAILLLQQHSPPMCLFMLSMLPQNATPQLCFPSILQ